MLLTRFFLSLVLSFYSTRLTLQVLCDVDYGINNIIGGLIAMFAIISMPLTNSLQRYFNVELAKKEIDINVVFNTSLRLVLYLIVLMIILYETIGLYVVNNILDYPAERAFAVGVSYQITAIVTMLSFISLPFMGLFYAKEMMGLPASVDLIGNILKIVFLFVIPFLGDDMLILFTAMTCAVSLIQFIIYASYCRIKIPEIKPEWLYDKGLYKGMLKFSGWNSIESVAGISITYLSNILINVFGGVLYNTANGLSKSITNAVLSFTTNVMKAVEPQITSATVLGDRRYRDELVCLSIKISMLATCFVAIFFYFDGQYFLQLWLGHVPQYAFDFCFVMITASIFSTVILPLRSLILATGRVKSYFITYGIIAAVDILIMFVLLKSGINALVVVYMVALASLLNLCSAIYHACHITGLSLKMLITEIIRVVVISCVLLMTFNVLNLYNENITIVSLLVCVVVTAIIMGLSMLTIGMNSTERVILKTNIEKFRKLLKKNKA